MLRKSTEGPARNDFSLMLLGYGLPDGTLRSGPDIVNIDRVDCHPVADTVGLDIGVPPLTPRRPYSGEAGSRSNHFAEAAGESDSEQAG